MKSATRLAASGAALIVGVALAMERPIFADAEDCWACYYAAVPGDPEPIIVTGCVPTDYTNPEGYADCEWVRTEESLACIQELLCEVS
jgi:hypothetical protein